MHVIITFSFSHFLLKEKGFSCDDDGFEHANTSTFRSIKRKNYPSIKHMERKDGLICVFNCETMMPFLFLNFKSLNYDNVPF